MKIQRLGRGFAIASLLGLLLASRAADSQPEPRGTAAASTWWRPSPGLTWQYQLSGLPVDQSVPAQVFDIDAQENSAAVVASLHKKGRRVIAYISAGSWEKWRPDAAKFPPQVLGRGLDGWPGERWLDVRRLDILGPILEARMDVARAKGFDAVDFDNVDGYANKTGFPLTGADQLRFNAYLARAAHARGLAVGLKNDLEQVPALLPLFDFAINEQCFEYDEAEALLPFIRTGKAVFNVEYTLPLQKFAARARAMRFSSIRKRLALDAYREAP